MIDSTATIHSSSIIDPGAVIGRGTSVWHFCHIRETARIGSFCSLGQNTYVDAFVTIGDRVRIQNNVSIYQGVVIEDDVFVGPSVAFTNVMNPRSFVSRKHEFRSTIIRKGSSIGANATILPGINVGEYALVGAGAVVLEDVLPFSVVVGNPARRIGWVSRSGTKLDFSMGNRFYCVEEKVWYELVDHKVSVNH